MSPDNLITVADVGDLSQQWGKIENLPSELI
jgi:hypothetical protein